MMNLREIVYSNLILREAAVRSIDLFGLQSKLWDDFQRYLKESWPSSERHYSKADTHKLYRDFLRCYMKDGFNLVDYFSYAFITLSKEERITYISERDRGKFHRLANREEYNYICADKTVFNNRYAKYIERDWMVIDDESDKAKFLDFIGIHKTFIGKPRDGQKGQGIKAYSINGSTDVDEVWNDVLNGKFLIEEQIMQHSSINRLHPNSVNTIRISTAIDLNGDAHVMASVIRVGAGKSITDNASAGGLFAGIDIETGTIISPGIDLKSRRYLRHPDTEVDFLGFKIPKWKELLALSVEVAEVTKELRYIGWDWVLTSNGAWELLEGNEPGGVHILQQGVGRGLKKEYESILNGSD